MNTSEKLAELRHSLARCGLPPDRPALPLGVAGADEALGGGLRPGALHEIYAGDWAGGGFAACLALKAAGKKQLFWVRPDYEALEYGEIAATGLAELGGDPANLVLLRAPNAATALAAGADILACPHVGALVLELSGNPKNLDLVASRRLAFAAALSGVTVLLLREGAQQMPSAAQTRWQVSAAANVIGDDWGNPVFAATLLRNRLGPTAIGPWNGTPKMDFSTTQSAVTMRRIMALWLPRLPTDRHLRKSASPSDIKTGPLVVSARAGNALYVYALDVRAQQLGLYKGQPLAAARAMVRELGILPADEKADAALLENMADWCDRFTPMVAADAPDGLLLDITGAAHLFGGEAAMLSHVTQKIAAQGFAVRGAIAGNALCARALARHVHGVIAPSGMEAEALAPLPVAALDAGDKATAALRRAGLKTVAQVAARERSELAARFGKEFVVRLEVLLGQQAKPIDPRRPLPDLMAEQRFAEPIIAESAITQSLQSLAQSLSGVLEQRGLGLRTLEAAFFRADGAVSRIAVRVGTALRDPAVMLRLLRERLDALSDPLDPGFGFDVIRLEACLTEKTQSAAVSFDADENARRQVGFLVDRLSARFGEHRVLRFVPQDTHIPEAQSVAVPAQDRDYGKETWRRKRAQNDPPRRPLRLFAAPEEVSAVAAVPDGPPLRFRWRRAHFEVTQAEGPERIAMEWWRQDDAKPTRDYFRVETREGQRFWLYRDGLFNQNNLAPRWYLQGIFA